MNDPSGPLQTMAMTTPTHYWNDSCSPTELHYALARGAVGATSNPVIILNVLKNEGADWKEFIAETVASNPSWSEIDVAWKVYEALAIHGSKLLLPVFESSRGKLGRLSIQTNPAFYRNSHAILRQTMYFHRLAPNFNIKIPATRAGIEMIEEATYLGVSINATVSFTVPQVIAAAEAVERGLRRREREGRDVASMSPVAVIMVGRLDDWLKVIAKRDRVDIAPESLEWPGVACFKKAYQLFQLRGYRVTLLAAAYRNFYHWTEFIGGDCTLTIPYEWQVKFNASDTIVKDRIHEPVDSTIMKDLHDKFPEFLQAYEEDGLSVAEFDQYGATVRTLRAFIQGWHDFVSLIRDHMLPNPDAS